MAVPNGGVELPVYMDMELTEPISPNAIVLHSLAAANRMPAAFSCYGSNDGVNWVKLYSKSGLEGGVDYQGNTAHVFAFVYELTVNATNGSVAKDPDAEVYPFQDGGFDVTLAATPDAGYTFVEWTGAVTGTDNPITVILDNDKVVTAVFASTNSALASIEIDGTALTDFDKEKLEYDVVLPVGASDVPVVTATAEDATATVVVTAATALPGTTTILVTAEDESTREYTINFTVDDTSVSEIISRSVIYPNPATDILRIEATMGIKSVRIFSIDGRAVHTDTFEQGYVSLQHLNKGMYLIRIEYIDGEFENRNFIKN